MEDLGAECNEEQKLEMMISGGDYSPNSHTFFKHPFKENEEGLVPLSHSKNRVTLGVVPG